MKLYYTKASPYARKVRMAAIEKGISNQIKLVEVVLAEKPQELLDANPLGKIPALITNEGLAIYDSPVICEYIEKLSPKPKLIPGGKKRFEILTICALADGMMDSAVGAVMETRRPQEKQSDDAIKKHKTDIVRSVEALNKLVKRFKKINMASIAVAAAIAYLDFRHADIDWRKKNKKLAAWFLEFSGRESFDRTKPG